MLREGSDRVQIVQSLQIGQFINTDYREHSELRIRHVAACSQLKV